MPRKNKSKDSFLGPKVCILCKSEEDDEFRFGKLFHRYGLFVHHNCMFFASGLPQRAKASAAQAILGFKLADIKREIQRGQKLSCFYCKQKGATIGCEVGSCRKTFHFSCGIKNKTLHQYFGSFTSYCESHKPTQEIIKKPDSAFDCLICYCSLQNVCNEELLYTTCCKDSWYHKICLQKYAASAGLHFFKCPKCNNKTNFIKLMEMYGIYIPDKDASWELEENAFQEQYYRPDCMASICQCTEGKSYDGLSEWELLRCCICGSNAVHKFCGKLKKKQESWECSECQELAISLKERAVIQVPIEKTQKIRSPVIQQSKGRISILQPSGSQVYVNSHDSNIFSLPSINRSLNCVVQVKPVINVTNTDEVPKQGVNQVIEKQKHLQALKSLNNQTSKVIKKNRKIQRNTILKHFDKKSNLQAEEINNIDGRAKANFVTPNKENSLIANNQELKISEKVNKVETGNNELGKIHKKESLTNCCSSKNCIRKFFGLKCLNN